MEWLKKSVAQNLDEIFALADVNARLRIIESEKQALLDPVTVGAGVYGGLTAPHGRRMHGAGSTIAQTAGTLGGAGLGGVLGAAGGKTLADALKTNPHLLTALGAATGAGLGGAAGNYLSREVAPGPRQLGLSDRPDGARLDGSRDSEKQADITQMLNSAKSTAMPYVNKAVDWAKANPAAAAGIGGAGLGALGGMAANALNPDEDERNLLGSAAGGAAIGGGLGLGGAMLAQHLPGMLSSYDAPPAAKQITQQIEQAAGAGPSPFAQAADYANQVVTAPARQATQHVETGSPVSALSVPAAAAVYGGLGHAGYHAATQAAGQGMSMNPAHLQRGAKLTQDYKPVSGGGETLFGSLLGRRAPELSPTGALKDPLATLSSGGVNQQGMKNILENARSGYRSPVPVPTPPPKPGKAPSAPMPSYISPEQVKALSRTGAGRLGRSLPGLGVAGLGALASYLLGQNQAAQPAQ